MGQCNNWGAGKGCNRGGRGGRGGRGNRDCRGWWLSEPRSL